MHPAELEGHRSQPQHRSCLHRSKAEQHHGKHLVQRTAQAHNTIHTLMFHLAMCPWLAAIKLCPCINTQQDTVSGNPLHVLRGGTVGTRAQSSSSGRLPVMLRLSICKLQCM